MIKTIVFLCRFSFVKAFIARLLTEFAKLEKKETKTLAEKCQEELIGLKNKKAIIYYQPKE